MELAYRDRDEITRRRGIDMNHRQKQDLIEKVQLAGLVLAICILVGIYSTVQYQKQHTETKQEKQDVHETRSTR